MTDKQIIIDGLSCDNCPESKRCQEQQTKKEYAINQVLQDIPSEYANVIDRLKQIIPSITRCDYVLEKQLKLKEQECEELKDKLNCCFCNPFVELNDIEKRQKCVEVTECFRRQLDQLKAECKNWKETANQYAKNEEYYRCQVDQLKAENEDLKERFKKFHDRKLDENADLLCKLHKEECLRFKAEQELEKIKPILEYYANSYIGEKQLDGIYRYDLGNENCILYDPRKAKEGLEIIGGE